MASVDRIQGLSGSVAMKRPCRVATTANITLAGLQTIDDILLVAEDRVLVKNQTNAIDNGIWRVSTGSWSRDLDFDGTNDIVTGTMVHIISGTDNGGQVYKVSTIADPIILGTTPLTFSNAMISDASNIAFTPGGSVTIPSTVEAKLRELYSIKIDYGAVGDGVADDSDALINYLLYSSSKQLNLPEGTFRVTKKIPITRSAIRISGTTRGMLSPYTTVIKYDGPATSDPVLYVTPGCHGVVIEGLHVNANNLADIAIHVDVTAGSATQHPVLRDLYVIGYATRGIVMGGNSTSVINNGQMQHVIMERISWRGGVAGAIGLLVNAQNIEWNICNGLYFDPDVGREHLNHIYGYAGGINIQGLATTRAQTGQYAVIGAGSQIIINGWRTEDRYLLQCQAVNVEGPCELTGILHRSSSAAAGDYTIDWAGAAHMLTIRGTLKGSVYAVNSAARYIDAAVYFSLGGDYIFPGPQIQNGRFLNLATGVEVVRGGAPSIGAVKNDGTLGAAINQYGVTFPATQVPSSNANTIDDYQEWKTWTPSLKFGGGSTGMTTSTASGRYTKIGQLAYFEGRIVLTAKGSSTGNATIEGLGVLPISTCFGTVNFNYYANMATMDAPVAQVSLSGGVFKAYILNQGATGTSNATHANFTDTTDIYFSGIMNAGQ